MYAELSNPEVLSGPVGMNRGSSSAIIVYEDRTFCLRAYVKANSSGISPEALIKEMKQFDNLLGRLFVSAATKK